MRRTKDLCWRGSAHTVVQTYTWVYTYFLKVVCKWTNKKARRDAPRTTYAHDRRLADDRRDTVERCVTEGTALRISTNVLKKHTNNPTLRLITFLQALL